jgi:hypothetical protein
MQRASSLARTLSLPLHLSVNQASSKACERLGIKRSAAKSTHVPSLDRILLEAGPSEHHHDMADIMEPARAGSTRAMHGERSIAAVTRASTRGTLRLQPQIVTVPAVAAL